MTDEEMTTFLTDLEKMVPQQAQKWIDWDQSKVEQETWPRKITVSMWLKHETNLVTMIDLLKIMKEELGKNSLQDQWAKCEDEAGSQSSEETLGKSTSHVFERAQGGGSDESNESAFHVKLQISFFVGRDCCQIFTRGHADEGWVVDMHVVTTCTAFNDALLETLVKSC